MLEGPGPTRRELLATAGLAGAAGVGGCVGGWNDCDPGPVDVPADAWTHPDADAAGTGAVEGSVTGLEPRFVVESDGVFGFPVADRSGIYSGSGHGIYAFDHDGTERWVTGGQLSALEPPPTTVLRGGPPPVVADGHLVANVRFTDTGSAGTVLAGLYVIGADGERRWALESWEGPPLVGDDGRVFHLEHSSRSLRRKSEGASSSQDRARVRAFDVRTGLLCWSHDRGLLDVAGGDDLFDATEPLGGALRDDELVVVINDARTIRHLDRETGDVVADRDVRFSADMSPMIDGDVLYTIAENDPPGFDRTGSGHGPAVLAYDLAAGEGLWAYARDQPSSRWVSGRRPSPYAVGEEVLVWTSHHGTVALDADGGELRWSVDGGSGYSPVIVGDAVLLVEDGDASLVCRDLHSGTERHRVTTAGSFGRCIASDGNAYVLRDGERPGIVVYRL